MPTKSSKCIPEVSNGFYGRHAEICDAIESAHLHVLTAYDGRGNEIYGNNQTNSTRTHFNFQVIDGNVRCSAAGIRQFIYSIFSLFDTTNNLSEMWTWMQISLSTFHWMCSRHANAAVNRKWNEIDIFCPKPSSDTEKRGKKRAETKSSGPNARCEWALWNVCILHVSE